MTYARKIVLYTPSGFSGQVDALARQFISDGVAFVACVGKDCEVIEDYIDWVAIESGSPERNFILTSSHPRESLSAAIEFAHSLSAEYAGPAQIVEIT